MVKNKNIKVVNENGKEVLLSASIIVEYLKNYTSDWGSLSVSSTIAEVEDEFLIELDSAMNTFNEKIGYVAPAVLLSSMIDEVITLLKYEDPDYLTIFKSFNNLEKVAIYFILVIKQDRTTDEVFNIINSNYSDLSKVDIMIKLLSEVEVEETSESIVDPTNGLFKLLNTIPTHTTKTPPDFDLYTGTIEFKEFTFPMHSYNTNKRFNWIDPVYANDGVRNYFDRFNRTWLANASMSRKWSTYDSGLYKTTYWEDILKNGIVGTISGISSRKYETVTNYRDIISTLSSQYKYVGDTEKTLFKYVGENFFDFNTNSNTIDDQSSKAPLTMIKYMSSDDSTSSYFDRLNLKAGVLSYNSTDFNDLKTLLSYYSSDINFWLTSDVTTSNTAYSDYLHTQDADGFLTSNSKSETKGYFSNVMFIQSAIQRILYPRILKSAQGGYDVDASYDDIFDIDNRVYDSIFDSIVNNAFVYTDKDKTDSIAFDPNYEIIPNRVILETYPGSYPDIRRDFTNYKATNLYEFMINSIIVSKDNVTSDGYRKILNVPDMSLFNRQALLYKGNAINYNPIDTKVTTTTDTLTVADFDSGSIVYDFNIAATPFYDPSVNDLIGKINKSFFEMYDGGYSKLNYRDIKFFKLPVHSVDTNVTGKLNRNIVRVDRELLTDITDIANFNIEGLSLADFTYGEKSLLKEYIGKYRSIKNKPNWTDYETINDMIKELDYLTAWKDSETNVALYSKSNSYYKASIAGNPPPADASTSYAVYETWIAYINALKSTLYFPESLTTDDITDIQTLLNRSILKIEKNRSLLSSNIAFVKSARELIRNSAVDIQYKQNASFGNKKLVLNTISTYFATALKLIISNIKVTTDYQQAYGLFEAAYTTGVWLDTVNTLNDIKNVLLNDTKIEAAIDAEGLYVSTAKKGMIKELDIALYKLAINNFFDYISDSSTKSSPQLANVVFTDNSETGIIRYYSDIVMLIKFAGKYHELLPEYVSHLQSNVLDKYYNRIEAIKSLPTWDYESLHIRDRESDLKSSGGVNTHDYNIVWSNYSDGIRMIYNGNGNSSNHRITPSLYHGGLSNSDNSNIYRDRWWKKWLTNGSDAFSYEYISAFKIPNVTVTDNNIPFPEPYNYNTDKEIMFNKMKSNIQDYQSGNITNINSFKYKTNTGISYNNIGVPILLLGDDGSEWNKPNTIRKNSFSFENDFLNIWYTDEDHSGDGESYTSEHKLVSASDYYKWFGLGRMNLQAMLRHLWNMESSPMGNPYTVMNYDIFPTWDEFYDVGAGDFPWSTDVSFRWFTSISASNEYNMKFVLNNFYRDGFWSHVRLSGEDRDIAVDPSITNEQIWNNFYLLSNETFNNTEALKLGIFDIYNRNLRNRIYLTYMKWRYYNNQGVW